MPDLPSDNTTSAVLTIGGTYSDALEIAGDRDWVRIDLDPGEYVSISLNGVSLSDPYLRVYDSNSNLVAENDDGGPGFNSRLTIGSETGGTFYLEAGAYLDAGAGSYQLSAVATIPPGPVDALDSGRQRTDTATPITVYFVPAGQTSNSSQDNTVSEGWSTYERTQFMAALGAIAAVTNVTFVETTDPNADFQLVLSDFNDPGLLGYFFLPSGSSSSVGVFNSGGYGWNNTGGLEVGGLGYATIVHEALHGLGLEHPHDGINVMQGVTSAFGDYGDFNLNQGVYTTMSYNAGLAGSPRTEFFGNEAGPMALDIAALQKLYGVNTTHNQAATTYVIEDTSSAWQTIWDTGGVDEIFYGGSRNVTIDLRAATLLYEEGGGGFISYANGLGGGYTIANGVIIENATGGSGSDLLVGNDANNVLTGNAGNDTLIGGAGEDDLFGGANNDTVLGGAGADDISAGSGDDNTLGGSGNDTVDAGVGNDTVNGNSGNDLINSDSGTNTIYGSSGFDAITGGDGVDTIYGGSGDDVVSGGGSSDFLFGGRGNDTIMGGAGSDEITGGMGADILTGDGGADTFVFTALSDSWAGNGDEITDFDRNESDRIDLSVIDADLATAGDQAFTFTSGGAPTLTPGEIWAMELSGDTMVFVDRDGDGIADMEIVLTGATGITASDFIL